MPSEEALKLATLINDVAGVIADIGVFPTANYADLAAFVEAVRTRLIDIETDTGAITWGDITSLINDMGVFPTANYATLAAFVEDVRARLVTILADVTGLAGAAMRGTDGSALVADGWDAALATILDNFSAALIGNLGELDFDLQGYLDALDGLIDGIIADLGVFPTVNYATFAAFVEDVRTQLLAIVADTGAIVWGDITTIDGNIDTILADIVEGKLRAFRRTYAFASINESVANAAETPLTAPAVVTVTFPAGATLLEAKVVAAIKANNQTAAEHNIGVKLQRNVAAGGWVTIRDFTASPPLTLPEVDATADGLTLVEALAITTGQTVQFRWVVNSDNAGEVHYTQTFVLSVEYDFQ